MTWAQRIDQHDHQVGPQERQIVVAAVPEDDVRFGRGRLGDPGIVDARENHVPGSDMRLVFLALLNRAVGCGKVV